MRSRVVPHSQHDLVTDPSADGAGWNAMLVGQRLDVLQIGFAGVLDVLIPGYGELLRPVYSRSSDRHVLGRGWAVISVRVWGDRCSVLDWCRLGDASCWARRHRDVESLETGRLASSRH